MISTSRSSHGGGRQQQHLQQQITSSAAAAPIVIRSPGGGDDNGDAGGDTRGVLRASSVPIAIQGRGDPGAAAEWHRRGRQQEAFSCGCGCGGHGGFLCTLSTSLSSNSSFSSLARGLEDVREEEQDDHHDETIDETETIVGELEEEEEGGEDLHDGGESQGHQEKKSSISMMQVSTQCKQNNADLTCIMYYSGTGSGGSEKGQVAQATPLLYFSMQHTHFPIFFFIQDTRTHIVKELFNVEKSYVESLQFLVTVRLVGRFAKWATFGSMGSNRDNKFTKLH